MEIVVQVSANMAQALHQLEPGTPESDALVDMMETFNLTLEPMHRGVDDPTLQSYFVVEAPDSNTAQCVIDRLQQTDGIEAAYIKPAGELP